MVDWYFRRIKCINRDQVSSLDDMRMQNPYWSGVFREIDMDESNQIRI